MKFLLGFFLIYLDLWACDGGLLKRYVEIPERSSLSNEMTESQFKASVKKVESFFAPIVDRDHNKDLIFYSSWSAGTVNAFAEQSGRKMMVTIYGGLARHKKMTVDGLEMTLCHELGHHLGGYPQKTTNRWSSAEGQADYYSTMKCLRRLWRDEDNLKLMEGKDIPEVVTLECQKTYLHKAEIALCQRMNLAAKAVTLMLQELDHDSLGPRFERPDTSVVRQMDYMHPFSQCRLDTFFQGSLCPVSELVEFDSHDQTIGACHALNGDARGLRPRCWFLPKN